eukprot:403337288
MEENTIQMNQNQDNQKESQAAVVDLDKYLNIFKDLRLICIKLKLPVNVFLDALLYTKLSIFDSLIDLSSQSEDIQGDQQDITQNKPKIEQIQKPQPLSEDFDSKSLVILLTTCLYLSAKINEYDRIRLRDYINVAYFQINESAFVHRVITEYKEKDRLQENAKALDNLEINYQNIEEIDDGIFLLRESMCDYQKQVALSLFNDFLIYDLKDMDFLKHSDQLIQDYGSATNSNLGFLQIIALKCIYQTIDRQNQVKSSMDKLKQLQSVSQDDQQLPQFSDYTIQNQQQFTLQDGKYQSKTNYMSYYTCAEQYPSDQINRINQTENSKKSLQILTDVCRQQGINIEQLSLKKQCMALKRQ